MAPNVLLVVLDSVRARNVEVTGHSRETTPFLSQFADRATVYDQARSAGARSITGHASLFTGRTVEGHGLTSADRKIRPGSTVFETLRSEGYVTGVFSENVWITEVDIGLRNGFDTVVGPQNVPYPSAIDPRRFVAAEGRGRYGAYITASLRNEQPFKSLINGAAIKLSSDFPRLYPFDASAPGQIYIDRFLDWQSEQTGAWAACINLMDAHSPYEPAAEHNRWGTDELMSIQERKPDGWELLSDPSRRWMLSATESLYDGAIRQLDTQLERLIRTLDRRDELHDTLLVITSDHGEGFGEPSRVRPGIPVTGHNTALHEVVLHVPLVVKFPGQTQGKRVSELASLTEFPTAVERGLEGDARPEQFRADTVHATSYGLLMDDQLRSRAERFQDPGSIEGFNDRLRAVYKTDDKAVRKDIAWGARNAVRMIVKDAQTAYVTDSIDPAEVDGEFDGLPEDGLTIEGQGIEAVDESTQERLEDLGYM